MFDANEALDTYRDDTRDDTEALTAILTDLRHWADEYGVDYTACDRKAHHRHQEDQ